MEELIGRVAEKAGISQEQAQTAVNTVAEFLKEKVPAPYSSYIDNFLASGGSSSGAEGGGLGGMAAGLGGMFGNKE